MATLALAASAGACTEAPDAPAAPDATAAPDAATAPDTVDAPAPWHPDDRQVSLTSFGYWGGSFEWMAPREALTQEQREALSGLRPLQSGKDCVQDIQEFSLTLVGADGQERRLVANELDAACNDAQAQVAMESLRPLLATLSCVGTGQAREELSSAQLVQAGDGCRHGFFAFKDEPPRWVKVLPASSGGVHAFQLSYCGGKSTRLELFDGSGTQLLASSSADGAAGSACPSLLHPLDPEAIYALRVTSQAVTTGGHVVVEVRKD